MSLSTIRQDIAEALAEALGSADMRVAAYWHPRASYEIPAVVVVPGDVDGWYVSSVGADGATFCRSVINLRAELLVGGAVADIGPAHDQLDAWIEIAMPALNRMLIDDGRRVSASQASRPALLLTDSEQKVGAVLIDLSVA